jgi:hypothetical protein
VHDPIAATLSVAIIPRGMHRKLSTARSPVRCPDHRCAPPRLVQDRSISSCIILSLFDKYASSHTMNTRSDGSYNLISSPSGIPLINRLRHAVLVHHFKPLSESVGLGKNTHVETLTKLLHVAKIHTKVSIPR